MVSTVGQVQDNSVGQVSDSNPEIIRQVSDMSTKISLRIPDDLLNPIDDFAAEWLLNRSETILKLLGDGLRSQSSVSILERLEALEKEVSELKRPGRPTRVRQSTEKRPTCVGQPQDDMTKPRLPPTDGKLFHPRDCAALLELKYPSGWEGLTHRQGTEFERDGYHFVRSNQKQGRAFLWSVSQKKPGGEVEEVSN